MKSKEIEASKWLELSHSVIKKKKPVIDTIF